MQQQEQTTLRLADTGERFVAYLIDGVIGFVLSMIVAMVFRDQAMSTLVSVGVGVVYTVSFWTTMGATPGKQVMGLRVVKRESGEIPDIPTALLRYVGYYISAIPLFLGFFWAIWDENKETWHDKIAGTRVVKSR
jgi:uncharacterized RDD family membrane protein YckC